MRSATQDACAWQWRRARRGKAQHASLHRSAKVRASNDLLAGVTTFLETDPAKQIDVEHLCDEGLVSGSMQLRQSGTNVIEMPLSSEALISDYRRRCGCKNHDARIARPTNHA